MTSLFSILKETLRLRCFLFLLLITAELLVCIVRQNCVADGVVQFPIYLIGSFDLSPKLNV